MAENGLGGPRRILRPGERAIGETRRAQQVSVGFIPAADAPPAGRVALLLQDERGQALEFIMQPADAIVLAYNILGRALEATRVRNEPGAG